MESKQNKKKAKVTKDSSAKYKELEFMKQISKSKLLLTQVEDADEIIKENHISVNRRTYFTHRGHELMMDYKITSIKASEDQSRKEGIQNHRQVKYYVRLSKVLTWLVVICGLIILILINK